MSLTASLQSDPTCTSCTSFGSNDAAVQGVASNVVHYWHHGLHNYVRLKRKVLQYSASWWLTHWNNIGFSEVVPFTSSHIRPTALVLEPCLFLQPPKKTFLEVQNRKSEVARTTETLMTFYQSTRCYFPGYLNLYQLRCWNVECHSSDIWEGCILF